MDCADLADAHGIDVIGAEIRCHEINISGRLLFGDDGHYYAGKSATMYAAYA